MFSSEHKLRHLPFFEEISRHEESDAAWKAAAAGLLVLRLVDAWVEEGSHIVRESEWTLRSVRAAVGEVELRDNLRSILATVVDVVQGSAVPSMSLVAPRLMAYGQFLEYEAAWLLAEDVYTTIIAHADPAREADAATHAHLRRGFCLRHLGDLTESVAAYQAAGRIATVIDDMEGVLRARIGEAKTNFAHGNFPLAASILDETIGQAAQHNLTAVRSMALHDRATVAGVRGELEVAIKLAYEALETSQSPRERDRILADIAVSFYQLGVRSAARDAYLILAATAQEQYGRWMATLNLMEVAADDGDEFLFEHYRRLIDVSALSPELRAQYWLDSAKGLERFGRLAEAQTFLERAIAVAEEHSLNRFVFDAEKALSQLGRHEISEVATRQTELEDEELRNIVSEISARRLAVAR